LRQSAQTVESSPAWKQEVNLRIAQHRGRKTIGQAAQEGVATAQPIPDSPAAKAAARVAARYAKAPSYSEMIAEEARAALRSTSAAPPSLPADKPMMSADDPSETVPAVSPVQAAVPVPSLTEPVLIAEPAQSAQPVPLPEPVAALAATQKSADPCLQQPGKHQPAPFVQAAAQVASAAPPAFKIRFDSDLPVRDPESAKTARTFVGTTIYEVDPGIVASNEPVADSGFHAPGLEMVEPAQPIHANLIHFPRELVATHKARPRRAEGIYAAADDAQLSIFEAEAGAVSSESTVASVAAATGTHAWSGAKWSSIQLREEVHTESAAPVAARQDPPEPSNVPMIRVAPLNRRILAGIVDFSLITGSFLTAAIVATLNTTALPSLKEMEIGSIVVLVFLGAFYQAFFFSLSRATPGMQYAGLALSTFSGKRPGIAQRCLRAGAMVVSLLPLGLGAVWALFDEQQMTWHDHLSGTYLRKT